MSLKSLLPVGRESKRSALGPFDPFTSLQKEVDRLFEDFGRGWSTTTASGPDLIPIMDVTETDKEIELTAELPGLQEKDVQVNFADNVLTVKGEKKAEKEEKEKNYRLFERRYGSFSRSIELPEGTNADAIKATISNGVLKVTIPKPAPAQVKKVEVKSAA